MRPIHITFTGLDRQTPVDELVALSKRFSIEWGILFHPDRQGEAGSRRSI